MSKKRRKELQSEEYINLVDYRIGLRQELDGLRMLKKNLESGVIMRISPDLVRLLMEKDWSDG